MDQLKRHDMKKVDIRGPEGNVFALIGLVAQVCRERGVDHTDVVQRMTSQDYEHALDVIEEEFNEWVTLVGRATTNKDRR